MRVHNLELLTEAVEYFIKGNTELDLECWLNNPNNIILVNDKGDAAIFEDMGNHLVNGHYYFKSKGKQALQSALNFLDEIFSECYNIHVIRGFTPITNLGARWMSRQLGFKSQGVVQARGKPYELFILTKKEFMHE